MKTLSELLIEEKIITHDKMDLALKEQENNGGILGLILLSRGYITRDQLMRYISHPDMSLY